VRHTIAWRCALGLADYVSDGLIMSKILIPTAAIIMLGLAAPSLASNYHEQYPWGRASAGHGHLRPLRGSVSLHGYCAAHPGDLCLPEYAPQQPVTSQFNNPGPQISVPEPGDTVDQLPHYLAPVRRTRR
jgi:hypothetical protein